MALTAEQLALAANLLTRLWVGTDCAKEATAAVKALDNERHRLLNGPFTLAEARASGKPFREIGGNPEYYEAAFPSRYYCNHCEIETSADKMMWLKRKSDRGHWASFYDIDAGKYELMPEGGE